MSQQEDVGAIDELSIAPIDDVATNNDSLFVAAVVKSTNAQPLDNLSRGCVDLPCNDTLSPQGTSTLIQCWCLIANNVHTISSCC